MSATTNYPFATPGNYTYDSGLIEVTGGVAKLVDLTPTDATCAATFTVDENLNNWSLGSLTGTLLGSAAVAAGKLDCTSTANDGITYAAAGNADFTDVGCIRFKLTPNYTGTPAANAIIFQFAPAVNNEIYLRHNSSGGNLVLVARSDAGAFIINNTIGAFSPTAGVEYEFELNFDISSGATRLFIDGVQSGATITSTGTRLASTTLYIGRSTSGSGGHSKYDNIIVFDTIQHTANYTPGYTVQETKYSTANPSIITNSDFKANSFLTFTTTETIAGSDAVTYVINASGQGRYVTGGSAANSDGSYGQSASQSDMASDIENIISARKTITLKSFLHSDDGSTTPELDLASFTYNAALGDPTTATLTELEGWVYTAGTESDGVDVKIRPYQAGFINEQIFHQYAWQTVGTTDEDGHFFAEVYVQPSGKYWEFKAGGGTFKMELRDQAENSLFDLPTFEAITDE